MIKDPAIQGVADTAFMTAAYRAIESDRPNALFHDPLASRLAGTHGRRIIDALPKRAFLGGWTVVIRTRIIDDLLRTAIAEGVDTVVNLGAGLDTRPYRISLPPTLRWVEVDCPSIIELKDRLLADEAPACQLERVKLDLSDERSRRQLLDSIAARSKTALVLTEGVIPYLAQIEVASLAADLRGVESVRYWVADYFSPQSYAYRRRSGMSQALRNAPFRFEPEDYFGFFKAIGWMPRETRYLADEGMRLRRPAPFPLVIRWLMRIAALTASTERRRTMNQYAGYVLFVPGPSGPVHPG